MRIVRIFVAFIFATAGTAQLGADTTQRSLQLPDILAWKRILAPAVSSDGHWLAYKLSPNEGDSEIVVRNLKDGKEQRYRAGESPRPDPYWRGDGVGLSPDLTGIAFSADGHWLAFPVYPTAKEAKQRKPVQTKAVLIELATGKKTEFDGIRRFQFSGERSSTIAFHRYPATPAPTPAGAAPVDPGAKPDERPQGSDLILYDLATGAEQNLGNVSEFAFDKKGNWLAWLIDAQEQFGNGLELRNMSTGTVATLDSAKASYKRIGFTEKGDGVATLRGIDDKDFEEKLYTIVAFKDLTAVAPTKVVYDPAKDPTFPKLMTISANRPPSWMEDLSELTFGIQDMTPKEAKQPAKPDRATAKSDDDPARPNLVIWHWKDDRLQSMQQVQENADRNFSYLAAYLPDQKRFLRLSDNTLRRVTVAPNQKNAVGMDIREYELTTNLDGKRFQDVYTIDLKTGERKLALRRARWFESPSPDATHLAYYEEGSFFSYNVATGKSVNLTKQLPATFIDTEEYHNVEKPPTLMVGWSKDGAYALITDNWDIWKVPAAGGPGVNLTVNGKKDKIRYRAPYRFDPDEKGIDLSKPLYVGAFGEWSKKGGLGIIEPGHLGVRMAHWDDAVYTQVIKAKNAPVFLYSRENTQDTMALYLADATLANGQKVTDANPQQKDFFWTKGVRLIQYTGFRGDQLLGDLYLPANYEQGKTYPVIVYVYEKLTQATNSYPQPGNAFSISAYTSNGYAVLEPDITYKVNDPGISGATCIEAALKAAIATGIVDSKRAALHGHSWGGYQTAFTVTHTNAFRAAIAGAPLTDLISMYSSIFWNSGTTNQVFFEIGPFTGGYLENQEAYIRNSPVYHAKNVQTPLLILHNDKDGAVGQTQGIEYYNTLRRLQKPVIMLEYKGENHGLIRPENIKDYTVRMKEFFDYYLMDKPAPKWLMEGIPLLKMKDHLTEREKEITRPPSF